jgi:uncharacterized protein (UPF0333 family)
MLVQSSRRFRRAANPLLPAGIHPVMTTNRQFSALLLGAALVCASGLAFSSPTAIQDSGAKQDMKDAGHDTKNAAKSAANGTKKGTKKAYSSTKNGTKKAASKTKNATKGAVEGGKEGAKQPQ